MPSYPPIIRRSAALDGVVILALVVAAVMGVVAVVITHPLT